MWLQAWHSSTTTSSSSWLCTAELLSSNLSHCPYLYRVVAQSWRLRTLTASALNCRHGSAAAAVSLSSTETSCTSYLYAISLLKTWCAGMWLKACCAKAWQPRPWKRKSKNQKGKKEKRKVYGSHSPKRQPRSPLDSLHSSSQPFVDYSLKITSVWNVLADLNSPCCLVPAGMWLSTCHSKPWQHQLWNVDTAAQQRQSAFHASRQTVSHLCWNAVSMCRDVVQSLQPRISTASALKCRHSSAAAAVSLSLSLGS